MTPHLDATLDGLPVRGVFPSVPAEILVGIYAAGHRLTVTRRMPGKKDRPDLEQIIDADEVWALCVRKPAPGWRLLGRWYDKNVFVALRAWDKHKLAGHYEEACDEVIADWTEEFGVQTPHRGNNLNDYVGGVLNELA